MQLNSWHVSPLLPAGMQIQSFSHDLNDCILPDHVMIPGRCPEDCSEDVAALIDACTSPDPSSRPTARGGVLLLIRKGTAKSAACTLCD